MAARLHMNQAMLIWAGSAVRIEEAFPDAEEQEESGHAQDTDAEGVQKRVPALPGYNFTGAIQTTDSATCAAALSRLTNLKLLWRRKNQFPVEPLWS